MALARKDINEQFSFAPKNLEEAMNYAKLIADSDLAPKDFKGKPGNVLIAIQMGAELGLKPIQSLQNIAVINGRPAVWGDSQLAIVKAHPEFEDINEWIENGSKAHCTTKRKGQTAQTRSFSIDDAKKAGLWGKPGPWTQYPDRMLQMRARAFCLRDTFADALKGIQCAEEVIDLPAEDYTSEQKQVKKAELLTKLKQSSQQIKINEVKVINPVINDNLIEGSKEEIGQNAPKFEDVLNQIKSAKSADDLMVARDVGKSILLSDEQKKTLNEKYKEKQKEIEG